ncbi:calcium/calmodulin-dependent protein kinase, putative [Phytophthora infestans T30-4]|uniref:non-specific serine/threonine protein kinase n=2 Tax=Phytophthora infestans TaxID=4787 RepID=D0NDQ3_PHYIT|nr:calcium/calmodulin-dependent protein kinase, putative [Phytophthora infestans T30-4]EEY56210.1 calcium/calmodulin-dependent protein kinase, putative [Phytophthora infestans T30-4]KAF4150636.1 Protein kinase domain [Phytophthora infestans]|eukprot:XP_002903040.1 calcium/calmodulin-dependent protein kinase, putative [Phytophthora infestans T30-4]
MKTQGDSERSAHAPSPALVLQQPQASVPMSASQRRKQLTGGSSDRLRSLEDRRHAAGRRHSQVPAPPPSAPSYQHLGAIESVRTALSSTGGVSAGANNVGHEVILSGALNKRGQFFKAWLPRHLVLSRGALQVYRKNPYVQQQQKDVARLEKKLLKMEVSRADAIRVESTDAFKHHPFCFILVARKRSRRLGILSSNDDATTRSAVTFSSTGGNCFQHRKESNLDSRRLDDGPVVLYYLQAGKEVERQRWMRALQRWIEGESPAQLGRGILSYIVNNEYSNYRYGQKVVSSGSSRSVMGDYCSSAALSPASHAGRTVEQEFPVLANLIRDLHDCKKEDEMIYILDQVLGEVQDGANSGYIKKLIATAGEVKLEHSEHIWTTHVKTAYANIMKALQTASSGQEPSSQAPTLRAPTYATRQNSAGSMDSSASNRSLNNVDLASFHRFYKLGRKLGSGAFSVVHIATHRETRKQVAVKCIAKASLGPQDVHSLKQEVEVMSSLDHPNIVPLLDYFEEDRYYYIVTPLCTGGELFDDLVKRKSYTEEDARVLMKKLASAIDYLHSRGIVHRDLKPENILLKTSAPGAEVMIADFGFARPMNGSRRGTACGTPGYVAPEVVQGEPYGAEVDCWSLGVILFILLCGYPPFPGANHATVLDKVVKAEYKFESPYWDEVSDEAKDLVTELLTVDRTKRLDASGILAHPWMDETRASAISTSDDSEIKKQITRKCSDLLPALHQMRKHSLTHGSPKIRPSDMNVDDIELDELTMNSDKEMLERELADMDGF